MIVAMIVRGTNRLEARIDTYIARSDADRRALQASMDDFRKAMQRLAERQSHVEGDRAAPVGAA